MILLLLAFLFPSQTYAHFALEDGDVRAELHIEPDHSVLPNVPSTYLFTFTDPIISNECSYLFTLTKSGSAQSIYIKEGTVVSPTVLTFKATVEDKGIYALTLDSKDGSRCQTFSLPYELIVSDTEELSHASHEKEHGGHNGHYIHLAVVGIGSLISIGKTIQIRRKEKSIKQ